MALILKPRLCNFQVYVGGHRVIPSPLSFNLYFFEKKKKNYSKDIAPQAKMIK
jgi:hypothetical protein